MPENLPGHGLCVSEVREAAQGMMHPGKPDRVRASIIGLLAMIGIVLLLETVGLAQRTVQKGGGIEGFRELRWGTSIEQSLKIYQDLYFEKYVISDSKEEPRRVYVRRVEHGEIEDVVFDSIEYWFKGDHFYQVRAVLHSRIGPRTMVTRAENAFAKMNGRLRNRYGDPSGHKVDYVTEFIVVVRATEDLFTLTMQEKQNR
ncbi:MAG: hypothetical protein NCA08_11420 [Deltaproteobacteria bacterium]|nr:hypothetical protein [Candidatus Deferrimicrobium borealis]